MGAVNHRLSGKYLARSRISFKSSARSQKSVAHACHQITVFVKSIGRGDRLRSIVGRGDQFRLPLGAPASCRPFLLGPRPSSLSWLRVNHRLRQKYRVRNPTSLKSWVRYPINNLQPATDPGRPPLRARHSTAPARRRLDSGLWTWDTAAITALQNALPKSFRVHVDRTARGHRHYCDPGGAAVAGVVAGAGRGEVHAMQK